VSPTTPATSRRHAAVTSPTTPCDNHPEREATTDRKVQMAVALLCSECAHEFDVRRAEILKIQYRRYR
jgi:hypothetical protein